MNRLPALTIPTVNTDTPYWNKHMKTLFPSLGLATLVASGFLASASPAAAGTNMEKVDMVVEGIDQKPLYVNANASGYTGTEDKAHRYMVRVYAKAKGMNRVWSVEVGSPGKPRLFDKTVGKSEGWATYAKSLEIDAKPGSVKWTKTPMQMCNQMLAEKVGQGVKKADVLKNDRKTIAFAELTFIAKADSKTHNEKNKHDTTDGEFGHSKTVFYQVPVVCRAAL